MLCAFVHFRGGACSVAWRPCQRARRSQRSMTCAPRRAVAPPGALAWAASGWPRARIAGASPRSIAQAVQGGGRLRACAARGSGLGRRLPPLWGHHEGTGAVCAPRIVPGTRSRRPPSGGACWWVAVSGREAPAPRPPLGFLQAWRGHGLLRLLGHTMPLRIQRDACSGVHGGPTRRVGPRASAALVGGRCDAPLSTAPAEGAAAARWRPVVALLPPCITGPGRARPRSRRTDSFVVFVLGAV